MADNSFYFFVIVNKSHEKTEINNVSFGLSILSNFSALWLSAGSPLLSTKDVKRVTNIHFSYFMWFNIIQTEVNDTFVGDYLQQ